jgi:hypothetical protein
MRLPPPRIIASGLLEYRAPTMHANRSSDGTIFQAPQSEPQKGNYLKLFEINGLIGACRIEQFGLCS